MPNGIDKNLVRLTNACARFHAEHRRWPTEARLHPLYPYDIAWLLDPENFELLCSRLRLRTTRTGPIAVGDDRAHVVYGKGDDSPGWNHYQEAERWLGVKPRADLVHLD